VINLKTLKTHVVKLLQNHESGQIFYFLGTQGTRWDLEFHPQKYVVFFHKEHVSVVKLLEKTRIRRQIRFCRDLLDARELTGTLITHVSM
jgi:hypothetical protein